MQAMSLNVLGLNAQGLNGQGLNVHDFQNVSRRPKFVFPRPMMEADLNTCQLIMKIKLKFIF
jgi:hypothetical protein